MEVAEAIDLIRFTHTDEQVQIWADLGCGSGVFTKALASLLPAGSWIHAIDINEKSIRQIPKEYQGVGIETSVVDFRSEEISFNQMDGILMANSLHYVEEKEVFLNRMIDALGRHGYFLLVDYDTDQANHWVPYPISISMAEKLFLKCGARSFQLLNKRRSVFGNRRMYSALVKR
jgi:ubiquinone/menaquinone biosynthesis C-methylase UbiE